MAGDELTFTIVMPCPTDDGLYLTVRGGMNRFTQNNLLAGNPLAWRAVLRFCDCAHANARDLPVRAAEDAP